MARRRTKRKELEEFVGTYADALRHCAIDERLLAERLWDELHATKVLAHYDTEEGEWSYSKRLADMSIRQRARMDAQKVLDLYPEEKLKVEPGDALTKLFEAVIANTSTEGVLPNRANGENTD
jgi:hypothetical protein